MGACEAVVEVVVVNRARVVQPSSRVVGTSSAASAAKLGLGTGKELLKTVSVNGASGAIADHLNDPVIATATNTSISTSTIAVVGLHKARVANAIVGGRGADTTNRLLHDDSEDEAVVDASLARDLLDSGVDIGNLLLGVVDGAPAVPNA